MIKKKHLAICTLFAATLVFNQAQVMAAPASKPNIVIILADDMGYGDLRAYNPRSLIPTPHLDQMASDGVRFIDAHSPSAVCTPTRYALLTGRYAWRSRLKSGVLWGYSRLLIEEGTETIPSLLKGVGYHTAGIGKWHLGFGNSEADYFGTSATEGQNSGDDFGRLSPGPNEVGFDYFFGIPASLDMKPYLYVENGQPFTPLDGTLVSASGQRRYGGEGFWRKGQVAEGFVHQEVLPTITERAIDYIKTRSAKAKGGQPFFLYFALTAPHTPWLPSEEFIGRSGAGYYGDFSAQVDHVVGQVRSTLEAQGLSDNTLVIYTSDNGAHWLGTDIETYEHLANGSLRGQKADIYEGGHRVPFIATWPGRIAGKRISHQPTTLTDLMATIASLTGAELGGDAGPDSFDILPALLGEQLKVARGPMVHHALDGMFAIREGEWKLIEGLGSGGFTEPVRESASSGRANVQLYNLATDLKETQSVADEFPEIVDRLMARLDQIRTSGRSL